MDKNYSMRKVMEPLLASVLQHVGVKTSIPDLFVPCDNLTTDCFDRLKTVFLKIKSLVLERWGTTFKNSCKNASSTHAMYFRCVFFACDIENGLSKNAFDKLLNVFAVVINFNIETLIKCGVNFCDLSVDIFMVFYERTLKKGFDTEGGFQQFAVYILRYESFVNKNHRPSIGKNASPIPIFINHKDVNNDRCRFLTKKVLSITKSKLPTLAKLTDLKTSVLCEEQKTAMFPKSSKHETSKPVSEIDATRIASKFENKETVSKGKTLDTTPKSKGTRETSILEKTKKASQRENNNKSTSNLETKEKSSKLQTTSIKKSLTAAFKPEEVKSNSKRESNGSILGQCTDLKNNYQTNIAINEKMNSDLCERIVQQVIKYNNSKPSGSAGSNNQTYKKVDELLKLLTEMFQSLIDVLDESDDE